MRVLLLVNSTASSVTPRKRANIRKILARATRRRGRGDLPAGHATLLAHAAAEDDFDVVAVLAGDGTLNEAAAGLLHTRTALAPLPGGSTNVYSQTLGYPRAADDAARALLDALEHGSLRRVGVGMAGDRPFLFCAGIGFDASVIRRVERHSRWVKRMASHPLHIAAAVQTFFSSGGPAHPRGTSTSKTVHDFPTCASRSCRNRRRTRFSAGSLSTSPATRASIPGSR